MSFLIVQILSWLVLIRGSCGCGGLWHSNDFDGWAGWLRLSVEFVAEQLHRKGIVIKTFHDISTGGDFSARRCLNRLR
jgi:hypothetical protein